jgi:hypothetical protein
MVTLLVLIRVAARRLLCAVGLERWQGHWCLVWHGLVDIRHWSCKGILTGLDRRICHLVSRPDIV